MSEARKKILKLLADGKISVDEADELLEELVNKSEGNSYDEKSETFEKENSNAEEVSNKSNFDNLKVTLSQIVDSVKTNIYEKLKNTDLNKSEIKQKIKDIGGWVNNFVGSVINELTKYTIELSDATLFEFSIPHNKNFECIEKVVIENPYGSISIRENDTFYIDVKGKISKALFNKEQPIDKWFSDKVIKLENNVLTISIDPTLANNVLLELKLLLPKNVVICCKSVSASISIIGKYYIEYIKVVNSDVNLVDCSLNNFKFESVNGDLNINNCFTNLDFISTSGNCRIINSKLDRLYLQSINGSFEIESSEVSENSQIKMSTTTGNILVSKISGPWSVVKATTRSGLLKLLWPGELDKTNPLVVSLTSNKVGAFFYADSVSGDITFI